MSAEGQLTPGGAADLGVDAVTERGWREFQVALADRLAELGTHEDYGSFSALDVSAELVDGPVRLLRLLPGQGAAVVTANNALPADSRLSRRDLARLRRLGFARPEPDAPCYVTHLETTSPDALAALVVTVLREVFGVLDRAFVYLDGEEVAPAPQEAPRPVLLGGIGRPDSFEDLVHLVHQALSEALGFPARQDEDGDFPFRAGTGAVFVRVLTERPFVRVFSELVHSVPVEEDAFAAAHELNEEVAGVKFGANENSVFAVVEIPGEPFVADHLTAAVGRMSRFVEERGPGVAARTGGRVFFEPRPQANEEDGYPAGGEDGSDTVDITGAMERYVDVRAEDLTFPGALTAAMPPTMSYLLELDADQALEPAEVARVCGGDSALVLELIQWNTVQEIAWRTARDDAERLGETEDAATCEQERASAERTVALLRRALRHILLD